MSDFIKCPHCPKRVRTDQGLKSHITRLHRNQDSDDDRNLPSQALPCSRAETSVKFPVISNSSEEPFVSVLANLKLSTKVLRRIPKGARTAAAECFTKIIDECLQSNSVVSWERLLLFTAGCLQIPSRQADRNVSLATLVKQNINEFIQGKKISKRVLKKRQFTNSISEDKLAKIVEAKIADGDVKGAVRVLCSEDSFAPQCPETLTALIEKHPACSSHNISETAHQSAESVASERPLQVCEADVRAAILSFPAGSSGGLDMLRPQHLKDMLSPCTGNAGLRLLTSLTNLCNTMLKGAVPLEICPVLYGASLCALKKKGGGIRPIAVGNTLRRLAAKLSSNHIKSSLSSKLQPIQLGFGTKGGSEAAAHAARRFISFKHEEPKVLLKIDFFNAFNMVHRDKFLQSANHFCPEISNFLTQCYKEPSHLVYGEELISSQRGIQQGDPLGPSLFCMAVHPVATEMSSELNIWYLDDATLGGHPETVAKDFETLKQKSFDLGLEVNDTKCELFVLEGSQNAAVIKNSFLDEIPGIKFPDLKQCTLLGAPLCLEAIVECVNTKTQALERVSGRLSRLTAHVAYYILKNSQAIPKLNYVLRCSPTWKCEESLLQFDNTLRYAVESITNIKLEDCAWEQSSLPVSDGGLGLRLAQKIALPAFLASVSGVADLVQRILPANIAESVDPSLSEGMIFWCVNMNSDPPAEDRKGFQRSWERPGIEKTKVDLYERAASLQNKARLLSVSTKESGAFLSALPSAPLGTLLNEDAFRIAVGLRLGAKLCQAHMCACGAAVDEFGTHGLSCIKSAGRRSRHASVNDIIKRALISAGVPAALEPAYLEMDNNRRPDGVTQIPWSGGRSLVWDFTCTDSMAPSHISSAAFEPLFAASLAEKNKTIKYAGLEQSYIFTPIAVECLGSFGRKGLEFVQSVGRKISQVTGEKQATAYLLQRISIAVQRGNASSISYGYSKGASMEEFLELL